jgi:hypothetical protein
MIVTPGEPMFRHGGLCLFQQDRKSIIIVSIGECLQRIGGADGLTLANLADQLVQQFLIAI